jgi:uncharacterized membrane protein YdjX (TVP38/TMEM64 family)
MADMTHDAPKSGLARRLPILIILAVAAAGFFLLRDHITFAALAENRERLLDFRDANYVLLAIGFIAVYAAIVTFSLPGAAIASITGGFLFAIFPGTLFNMLAATLGAVGIFVAARWGFGEELSERMDAADGRIKKIKTAIDDNQWEALFLIRLIPVVPFFVANLVPALVGVPLYRFVVTTFLGIIPGAFVYTSIGAGLGEVFARGETPNLGVIFELHVLIPMLGLALLAALPIAIKALRGKKGL